MIINYTKKELDLLARIMRAEALSEGNLGMLMVGNVVVNRAICNCLTFKNLQGIIDVIYQKNQFSGISSPLFNSRATETEKNLAKKVLKGEYFFPASNALWFYAPTNNSSCKKTFYNHPLSGKYKKHCFYNPNENICERIH